MEIRLLSTIRPNPDNPRILKDARFKQLVQSLRDFPQMMELRPIVVDEDGVVLGGNMRLRALQEIGVTECPVTVARGLTPEQKLEFVIKDNGSFGEWDWDALANGDWPDAATLNDWGVEVPKEWSGEELADYSDRNKEIDIDEMADEMVLKFKFAKDDFFDVQERLNTVRARQKTDTNEGALKELLSFYERHQA
jgi:ParB-like nuclease domain